MLYQRFQHLIEHPLELRLLRIVGIFGPFHVREQLEYAVHDDLCMGRAAYQSRAFLSIVELTYAHKYVGFLRVYTGPGMGPQKDIDPGVEGAVDEHSARIRWIRLSQLGKNEVQIAPTAHAGILRVDLEISAVSQIDHGKLKGACHLIDG